MAKARKVSFTLLKVFLSGSIVLNLGSLKYPSGAFAESSPRRASADTKEKCSLLFGFARPRFFLLKGKGHFSLVFCPRSFWAGGGTNADSVLRKLFFGVRKCGTLSQDFERFVFKKRKVYSFCKKRISQNTRLIFFEFGSRKRRRRDPL